MRVAFVCAALILLLASWSQPARARMDEVGLPQCMRAETARFLNTPADARTATHRARTYPLVDVVLIGRTTVFVWERTGRGMVHRAYLLWPGRHRGGKARRLAVRKVAQQAVHPRHARPFTVLLGDNSRANARSLDRRCLNSSRS